jgi:phage tail tape-measure protein
MAAGFDGSITIDTSINPKGFNAGIKAMTGAVKGLGAVLGIALGIGALVAFGKTAVDTASQMSASMIGLQSVVEGTGGSFAGAQKFINGYIEDGLIPAMNAMTAYKNLAMRGYDVTQIEQTMNALKDSAAFGRQASLTMGQRLNRLQKA